MNGVIINRVEYISDLILALIFSDFFAKHPHPQYDKYAKKSEFKKYWLRNGNLIWGKHADLQFPINALYQGNLELCCDD